MLTRTIAALAARLRLVSNLDLIYDARYFSPGRMESLLTDYDQIADDPAAEPDATLYILDDAVAPTVSVQARTALARGPFASLEEEMADKRYTLLGNQGLVYRYLLFLLAEAHGIHSFHANALYDPAEDTLTIVLGGAASGKSPVLLAGVRKGLQVFGTELVHLEADQGTFVWHRAAAIDNIRPQSLAADFPDLLERLALPPGWEEIPPGAKYPLDLSAFAVPTQSLHNPRLRFLLPRVEAGRARPVVERLGPPGALAKLLFDNASEKIGSSFTLYNRLALPGFDTPSLAERRLATMVRLVAEAEIARAEMVLAEPRYFLEVL